MLIGRIGVITNRLCKTFIGCVFEGEVAVDNQLIDLVISYFKACVPTDFSQKQEITDEEINYLSKVIFNKYGGEFGLNSKMECKTYLIKVFKDNGFIYHE